MMLQNKHADYRLFSPFSYRQSLSASQKKAYGQLLLGLQSAQKNISCSCMVGDIFAVYQAVCLDHPELFFVSGLQAAYLDPEEETCVAMPQYRFTLAEIEHHRHRIQAISQRLLSELSRLNPIQKLQGIHDFLVRNVRYTDVENPDCHSIYGPLTEGQGVCEGIAKAFQYLAGLAGIPAITVYGQKEDTDSENGHAWNLVCPDGCWYHVDATFDNTLSSQKVLYDYFLLSDAEIRLSHHWTAQLPPCRVSYGFYARHGLFFDSQSALTKYIENGHFPENYFVFQVPSFPKETDRAVQLVMKTVEEALLKSACVFESFSIEYEEHRMIFEVSFS